VWLPLKCFLKTTKNFSKNNWNSIINEYGASELDLIAFQSQTGNKGDGINAETLFVEILDENGVCSSMKKGQL
jgi:phenylacetate-CoA ligase